MKAIIAAAVVLGLGGSVLAAETPFPPGYWDRGYATGNVNVNNFMLTLKVKSLPKAEEAVDRLISKFGGTMRNMNAGQNYYNYNMPTAQASKTFVYSLDAAKAEPAAKALFDLGELVQYNNQRPNADTQYDEIKAKIKQLQGELSANAEALKKMPIASYFLNTQLARLNQSKEAYDTGLKQANVTVTLLEPKDAAAETTR